ncbi:MAG: hypothetical protein LBD64_05250 [Odoribacteraceae bacterium]|jgi:hypothetical protein|nr:hypothetical protein [Odoribacteraceae bacterium]
MKKITLLLAAALLAGCAGDESLFTGSDNSIITFTIEKEGVALHAAISPGLLRISAPERLSLAGATASVTISENASITPDPANINNWDDEQTFTVVSYNGTKNQYTYRVDRHLLSREGDVTLLTQEELDAFAASFDADQIDGSLTIGNAYGQDSIRSVAALEGKIKVITRDLVIEKTFAGSNLAGLADNLEKVGDIRVETNQVRSVRFPRLSAVHGDVNIRRSSIGPLDTIDFPELVTIDRNLALFRVDARHVAFPKLQQLTGSINVYNSGGNNGSALTALSLPLLREVGGDLVAGEQSSLKEIDLPALSRVHGLFSLPSLPALERLSATRLERAGSLNINDVKALVTLDLPALSRVDGNITMDLLATLDTIGLPALEQCGGTLSFSGYATGNLRAFSFPRLESVHGITIAANVKNTPLDFPALKSITNDLIVNSTSFTAIEGFPRLETIANRLSLTSAALVSSIRLPALKNVGTLYLYNLPALKTLDLRGLDVGLLYLHGTTVNSLAITGNDDFPGNIYIGGFTSGTTSIPVTFQGFKNVGGLEINSGMYLGNVDLPFLERVKGLLKINFTNTYQSSVTVKLPALLSAGALQALTIDELSMPLLENITGYADATGAITGGFSCIPYDMTTLSLPSLKRVVGDLSITGLAAARPLSTLSFPLLSELTGQLIITGTSNTKLQSLEGLNALTSVAGVTISNFTRLVNFAPLKGVIPLSLPDAWKISGCGYNPTHQQMVDGAHAP